MNIKRILTISLIAATLLFSTDNVSIEKNISVKIENNSKYQLIKEMDITKIKLEMLTGRDIEKIKTIFENIKNGKNVEISQKELQVFGSLIKPILIEGLKDKNENIRTSSLIILDENKELKNVIENLFDELEFNNESLAALYHLKDIEKHEKHYLKAFEKSSKEIQAKVYEIAQAKNLNSLIKEYNKEKEKIAFEEQKMAKIKEQIKQEEIKKEEEEKRSQFEEKQRELKKLKIEEKQVIKKEEKKKEIEVVKEEKIETIKPKKINVEEIIISSLDNPETTYQAIIEVGNLKIAEAIPKLEKILSTSKNQKNRKQVLFSLTKIGNNKAKKILEEYANSTDRTLSFIAKKSLESLETSK